MLLSDPIDDLLFAEPLRFHRRGLALQIGEIAFQLNHPSFRASIALAFERLLFDLVVHDPALHLIDLGRHAVDLHLDLGRGFVDEIDRFVREEPLGHVAIAQRGRGDQRGIKDADAVVNLVPLLQSAQDGDCVRDSGLRDMTGWNRRSSAASFSIRFRYSSSVVAPMQRSSPRASAGFNRFAASIDPSAAPAPTIVWSSSMKRMIWPCGAFDFFEHRLQPVLELAAILRASNERAHIERNDSFPFE